MRKGTSVPYVAHLLAVASIALEHGASEDEAIAALLHDAIEDQGVASGGADRLRARLRERFGDAVVAIVDGCTDSETDPKPPWRPRKEAWLARLASAPRSVLLVVGADKLHNARSIVADLRARGGATGPRFTGGRDGTLWYYREVSDRLAARLPGDLAGELGRAVAEMERLALDQNRSV